MSDSRQQNCDAHLPRRFTKTMAEDPSLPKNPTIIVNDTESCDMSKEVVARRKQGNTSGPDSFSPSSPCELDIVNGTQQHNLHQPVSSRSSIDSGVGGLSRTNSSGSVKKTSVEGLLDKPGFDNFEPITEVSSFTEQPQDEAGCSILPESLDTILKLEDTTISSRPKVDALARHTEILGKSNDEKGDLLTGELRRSSRDTNTGDITSPTEDDEGSSWITCTRKERNSISNKAIEDLVKAVQVICNEAQYQPPHAVTRKPMNIGTTSEHVTETDSPFRIYPVRRHSTADVHIPLTQHSKQSERTRKRSAQPLFHHLVSRDDESHKVRKKSACIMCERNHVAETAESATSVFIRKAVTPMDCQRGRRYSEVLKTYKLSEIPFTEVRVLKMEHLRQNETQCHRLGHRQESEQPVLPSLGQSRLCSHAMTDMQLQEILERNMPTFLQCTNWSGIFGHLVAKRLLDSDCREIILCPLRTNKNKGNYFYGCVLPAMGRESNAYVKLYWCLEETKDEDPGHNTLFDVLRNGLKTYYYDRYCLATSNHQN